MGRGMFQNVQKDDDGTYECHAWNKFGEESESGNLIVRGGWRNGKIVTSRKRFHEVASCAWKCMYLLELPIAC